jgi:UDP-N-acetylmuramate--alanine ligase
MQNRRMPLDVGIIHFAGIGGIGMSGIAELLHRQGYRVQGSDMAKSANTERLEASGIPVFIGQTAEYLDGIAVVVRSTAVKDDNLEVIAARKRGIPVIRRAEMLAELMHGKICLAIAGTHGKTTTTSMMAALFDATDRDPTVINGGIITRYGSNTRFGQGEWLIAESDESDGTFLELPAIYGIITNVDREHLEYYGSFEKLRDAYRRFMQQIPFFGAVVACQDDPELSALLPQISDRRIFTYSIDAQSDVQAFSISKNSDGSSKISVRFSPRMPGGARILSDIKLGIPGRHNILNALSTIALGWIVGLEENAIRAGLENFENVKRRFTKTGETNGVLVIDDYGHHPTEIQATLATAREVANTRNGRIIAVIQPHRYSRVQALFHEFCTCVNQADIVFVSEIYSAGEAPLPGISAQALVDGMKKAGHTNAHLLSDHNNLAAEIVKLANPQDMVVFLGAGSVTQWAYALPQQLALQQAS